MPIGITNIHKQINVSEFINKLSFICVLWIRKCSELKWRQNYHFSTIIISNYQIETLVSYSRSTNVNVNMSFPNSNFEGNFNTCVFGKSFWHYRELKIYCWTSRHILCKKNIKYFRMCGGENSCRKVKCIRRSHFPQAITTNMQTGNDCFVFKYRVSIKNIKNSHYFYWN